MILIGGSLAVKSLSMQIIRSIDRPSTGNEADAVDTVADEGGVLTELETIGSGSRRMPSALML
jgi:hypothetical protein